MKESLSLRFLYHTVPGRELLRLLVRPSVSDAAAGYLSSPLSCWLIGVYKRKYGIDVSGCEKQTFDSFNDFFMRRQHVHVETDPRTVVSPCDGYLSAYRIDERLRVQIKHSTYTVAGLLQDGELAERFRGGLCCIFRLEPQHYHHYLYAVGGAVQKHVRIPGVLHCVRPIACEQFPVYIRNSREFTLLHNPVFGDVVQMEVGALLVGRIQNDPLPQEAAAGTEKGHFEYGGSTIIVLFQADKAELLPPYAAYLHTGRELPVTVGRRIAVQGLCR